MTALLVPRSARSLGNLLEVERTDIVFANRTPEIVDIAITVRNCGFAPSRPTTAVIQSAPLGAFVPWRPLATVAVPAIAPFGSAVLQLAARRPRPKPLGSPDRVPPQRLLTALAEDDLPKRRTREHRQQTADTGTLANDIFETLWHSNPHWAGNLNVFVGKSAVERHVAQALRVYPDRVNMAMFVVGTGRDAYAFSLRGEAEAWAAELYNMNDAPSLYLDRRRAQPLPQDEWIPVECQTAMLLAMRPPRACAEGTLEVQVTQKSTGQVAVVEFSLDPRAAGPGCFVVG